MSEQTSESVQFPSGWLQTEYDPNEHLMQLRGRDYLPVQERLAWFLHDQRALITARLAVLPHVVRTELVELDRTEKWAHFKTYVRDVLGNEATMYGSESAKDFADYIEKASTKSLGRALAALGYGTSAATDMDEAERVVDTPQQRRSGTQPPQRPRTDIVYEPAPATATAQRVADSESAASQKQLASIQKLCEALGQSEQPQPATYAAADAVIKQLSEQFQQLLRRGDDEKNAQAPSNVSDLSAKVAGPETQKLLAMKLQEAGFSTVAVVQGWLEMNVRGAGDRRGSIDPLALKVGQSNITVGEQQKAEQALAARREKGQVAHA